MRRGRTSRASTLERLAARNCLSTWRRTFCPTRGIIEALTDAAEHGVLIRLYLDRSQFAEHGPTRGGLVEALLAHPNVVARVKGEGVLMHLKAYAVDGAVVRTGSGNFSR